MNDKLRHQLWVIKDFIYVKLYNCCKAIHFFRLLHCPRTNHIQSNKIILNNFNGKAYGDNPKYIANEILKQNLDWDLVWLTNNSDAKLPEGVRAVEYGTWEEMWERATAKVWVDNVRHGKRPPKKEGQICLQTWHGGLNFKYVEAAAKKLDPAYIAEAKRDGANCDGILSGCALRTKDYKENFWLSPKTEFLEFGLPRNDLLFQKAYVQKKSAELREKIHLADGKKIILYMPTFRDDKSTECYALDYHKILDAFEQRFCAEFVLVVRLHPNVPRNTGVIPFCERIIDATDFPDAQELYMVSDYLITDYSSAAFDFSLLKKPVFLCMLDFPKYKELRGLNEIFYNCPFPHTYSCEELIEQVASFDEVLYWRDLEKFKETWQPFDDGHAAERTVDWIKRKMEE